MLFYERRSCDKKEKTHTNNIPGCSTQEVKNNDENASNENNSEGKISPVMDQQKAVKKRSLLSKDLEDWIWQDNRHYLEDRNIFEHTYFK